VEGLRTPSHDANWVAAEVVVVRSVVLVNVDVAVGGYAHDSHAVLGEPMKNKWKYNFLGLVVFVVQIKQNGRVWMPFDWVER
jgi:hypothetical protein